MLKKKKIKSNIFFPSCLVLISDKDFSIIKKWLIIMLKKEFVSELFSLIFL